MTGVYFPAGRSVIPANASRVVDDFDYQQGINTFRSRWTVRTTGGGSVLPLVGDTNQNAWCYAQFTSPAAVGTHALTRNETQLAIPNAFWQFNIGVAFPVLSTGAQSFTPRIGLGDQNTADFNNGIYWEYNDALNSGQWTACVAVGGVRTKLASGRFVQTTLTGLRVFGFNNTQAIFNINGQNVAAISGLPVLPVGFVLQLTKNVGAAAALMNVDYFAYYTVPTR